MRTESQQSRRTCLLPLLCISAVSFFILYDPLTSPKSILNSSDLISFYYYLKYFLVDTVRSSHHIPLWNPMTFAGFPFAANPQAGIFYPFTFFFLLFPVHYAFALVFFIHITGAGYGLFLFIRRKGISVNAALFGSIIFMMNYKVVGHIEAGHFNMMCCYAYIPWLLMAIENIANAPSRRAILLFSGTASLSFFAGHPQLFYYSMIVCGIYFLFLLTQKHKVLWRFSILSLLISIVLTLLISAVLLIPLCELLLYSNRAGGTGFETSAQSHIAITRIVWRILIPDAVDTNWEKTIYFGFLPLIIALFCYRNYLRRHIYFFLFLFVGTALFSCGPEGGLFSLFYWVLPGIKFFRAPARMFFFGELAIAVLAAFSLDGLCNSLPNSLKKKHTIFLFILSISFISSTVYALYTHNSSVFYRYGIQCLIAGSGLILLSKNLIKKSLYTIILMMCVLGDLGSIAFTTIRTIPMNNLLPAYSLFKHLLYDRELFRVWDLNNLLPQHVAIRFNTAKISGYQPITIPEYINYIQGGDPLMQDFLNVKYIASKNALSDTSLTQKGVVFQTDPSTHSTHSIFLYENTHSFPRSFIIPMIRAESPDTALTYYTMHNTLPPPPARIVKYAANDVFIAAQVETPSYLILSDILYPGWTAYVNGKPQQIYPVKTIFRSILLQPGQNRIHFSFRSKSLIAGGLITCTALIIYLTLVVSCIIKKND